MYGFSSFVEDSTRIVGMSVTSADIEAAEKFLDQFDKIRKAATAQKKSSMWVKPDYFLEENA